MTEADFGRARGGRPHAVIITDRTQPFAIACEALRGAGYDTIRQVSSATAVEAEALLGADLVLHDATADDEAKLQVDLARLLIATGNARKRSLFALVRRDQIDQATARLLGTPTTILCEPQAHEWRFSFSSAVEQSSGRLQDAGRDEVNRLHRLKEEVASIAERLSRLSQEETNDDDAQLPLDVTGAEIRAVIKARRVREKIFQGGLLSDPVWDMLLELTACEFDGHAVTTTNLCIASTAPLSTALRWIGILDDAKLIERYPDPHDRRRVFVRLSGQGRRGMSNYLATVKRTGLPLV